MSARSRKGVDVGEAVREYLLAVVVVVIFMLLLAHGWTLQEEVEAQQRAHWRATVATGDEAH